MVKKRQTSEPPKFLKFIANFIRLGLISGAVFCGLLVVVFLFVSQIDTRLSTQNILFVPKTKDGNKGQIILASINGNSQKVFVYEFPSDLKSKVIGGYGEYPLGSVLPLLKMEKKDEHFILATFSNIFQHSVTEFFGHQSNEERLDKWKLIKMLSKQRSTWALAWQIYKLNSASLTIERVENWQDWEKALNSQLIGKVDDQCSVAVVNTTKTNGLASQLSGILEKSGVDVVRTTDSIWDQSTTAIYQAEGEPENSECDSIIKIIQSVSPVKLGVNIDKTKPTQYRAKVVFFIGDELADILSKDID